MTCSTDSITRGQDTLCMRLSGIVLPSRESLAGSSIQGRCSPSWSHLRHSLTDATKSHRSRAHPALFKMPLILTAAGHPQLCPAEVLRKMLNCTLRDVLRQRWRMVCIYLCSIHVRVSLTTTVLNPDIQPLSQAHHVLQMLCMATCTHARVPSTSHGGGSST